MQKSNQNQNPSRYYNSIKTNLKFQHKPKYHPSSLKLLYSIMKSKHNILALVGKANKAWEREKERERELPTPTQKIKTQSGFHFCPVVSKLFEKVLLPITKLWFWYGIFLFFWKIIIFKDLGCFKKFQKLCPSLV